MSKRLLPSNEILIDLYVKQKKTCKEICRMYGLKTGSSTNLGRMLKKMGVKIRKDAGENHHNWKGGKINKGDGYIGIWFPNHKKADNQGYVYEHTLIMENHLGREIIKGEEIHHINLNKRDNDIQNLCLCTHKIHLKIHRSIENIIPYLLEKGIIFFDEKEMEYKINKTEEII